MLEALKILGEAAGWLLICLFVGAALLSAGNYW